MEINENMWKISGFTEKVNDRLAKLYPEKGYSVHFNTLDGWFKELELKGLHYIQRSGGGKVYDESDIEIALFIYYFRKEKNYSLDATFDVLVVEKELRPFPPGDNIQEIPKMYQEMAHAIKGELERMIIPEVKRQVKEELEGDLKSHFKQILLEDKMRTFDPEKYKEEQHQKEQQLAEDLLMHQPILEQSLKEEGLIEWEKQPETVRFEKKLFGKKEKTQEKEKFIQAYVNKHREKRIKAWIQERNQNKGAE